MTREEMKRSHRHQRSTSRSDSRYLYNENRNRSSPERRGSHREVYYTSSHNSQQEPIVHSNSRHRDRGSYDEIPLHDKGHSHQDREHRMAPSMSHHRNRRSRDIADDYNGKHSHKHKRKTDEELEELSRRKRKIESELSALDALEAAEESKSRPGNRSTHQRETVRVKEEPVSDDEHQSRNRRRNETRGRRQRNDAANDGTPSPTGMNWGRPTESGSNNPGIVKEKPNFETSGKLAEDTNTYNGVVIKYNEPKEARKPKRKWRLYPFKGDSSLPFVPVHRQSAYLLGRSRLIADIPIDHPSCSKQHAVLQYRVVPFKRSDGTTGRTVRPYIIDLDSSNGTYVNNKRVEPRCYVELMEKDVLKFGFSTRVYVILHEESKNPDDDDGNDS